LRLSAVVEGHAQKAVLEAAALQMLFELSCT